MNKTTSAHPSEQLKIYEQVVLRIQEMLRTGTLTVGDKLPPERDLASTFQVSRSSIREAIRSLQEKGIVESRRGNGTFVVNTGDILEPLAEAVTEQRIYLLQIMEFRQAIEPAMAGLAARNATPEQLKEIAAIMKEKAPEPPEGDPWEKDIRFHCAIAKASGNPLFEQALLNASTALEETRQAPLQTPERRAQSCSMHKEIFSAIVAGDETLATECMRKHLEQVHGMLFTTE
ncbi:FadR/GntR family transcriptional regulator [Halodesulfovibrio marinisediminis]|uniref:GntR family transcriptional regulator, transcriptional repressor for pyruvate dehydrogenase complex n=1 Tax=Halodesulfovibrio marinisediminis DSM 17456 TaxID=1121457 RepID=A0A1N6F919_9BACT|nr:FadR/GntR family transcriptional regulator [Halodesulfovibrio marinisediminis]SIN91771.1 GntR family transcriptional regulator, transcriptional repressor for pyruvate dehydrogenase complex [Halodesulfovibrio marinisediminis DSM 17456]